MTAIFNKCVTKNINHLFGGHDTFYFSIADSWGGINKSKYKKWILNDEDYTRHFSVTVTPGFE